MRNIEDTEVKGEKLLLRTDLNLPIEDGEVQKTVRFSRYLETIKQLSEKNAKTVILAHQGRPGREDFIKLDQHAELLSEELGQEVELIESFFSSELEETVDSMENRDVVLMQNIRFLSEELKDLPPKKHANDIYVQMFQQHFDLYVDDAFSAAHRSHASMVGFTEHLDSYAGTVMQQELEACNKVRDDFESGVLVLGGEKPAEIVGMIEHMIEDVEKVLLGGVPGELALILQGYDLDEKEKWIRENGFDENAEKLKELLEEYDDKIELPEDLETNSGNVSVKNLPAGMTYDIGEETREKFVEEIENADAAVMKGPMGAFDQGHEEGSRAVVDALSGDLYAVLGGGHTSSLVQRFDHDLEEFYHVSIAGGAFVKYMSGEELAAVEALRN